jgi:NitT/TauT family transport system substrate-binding protein
MRRKEAAMIKSLLAIVALICFCQIDGLPAAEPRSNEPLKLRVGLGSSPVPPLPNSVLWLAKDLGFYQREGLDIELIEFSGTPLAIAAMISGDIDVGNVSTSEVIRMTATKSQPMRAIHSPDGRLYFLIAAREEIKSVQGLQGKTFAVARLGSVDHTQSMITLKALGVNPANLTVLAMGVPTTRAQALVAGRVDATTMSVGTWVTIQKEPGIRILVDHNTYFENATVVEKVNAATAKVVEEKPEQLRRFTAAILKTSRHFAENQEAWVNAITKRRQKLQRSDAINLWNGFKTSWAVNGLLNLASYQKTADFYYQSGTLDKAPKIEVQEWADTRFVDDVLKEIGVNPRFDPPGRTIR